MEPLTVPSGSTNADDDTSSLTLAVCFMIAALAHAAFGFGVRVEPPPAPVTRVTEIELAPPPPPPPEPPPVVEPEPPPPVADTVPTAPAPKSALPAAPAAARAGALMTAKPDDAKPPTPEAPVEFVTDPNGTSYGGGVVQRGGTSDFGQKGAIAGGGAPTATGRAPAAPGPAPKSDGITPAANLSRAAKLTEVDACRGYYPSEAVDDAATATLTVVVRPGGDVASVSVLAETPAGQGFGRAARACLLTKRFSPALDRAGQAVTAATTMNVRFSR